MNCSLCEKHGREIEMQLMAKDEFGPVTTEKWKCPYCEIELSFEIEKIMDDKPHFKIRAKRE